MTNLVVGKDFKEIIVNIKKDILSTRYKIIANANQELLKLYFRLGKIISENSKYGNNFIRDLSMYLRMEFPNATGFSLRNLSRMKKFYEEYKDFEKLPMPLAKLPWSHNYLLIEKIKDIDKRLWYAKESIKNNWSHVILNHQIDLQLYERQVLNFKTTNFTKVLPSKQGILANEIIKEPYIFELQGIKEINKEKDLEQAMLAKIKNVLLELGKGFSFISSQYKISTNNTDYYIDMLFYHLELRSYIVVELKMDEFKPEYIGQLGFYVTVIDETLKKEYDNSTIGLLLCKNKDKLTVDWSLKSTNIPIGISSYEISNKLPNYLLKKLPTEKEINKFLFLKK